MQHLSWLKFHHLGQAFAWDFLASDVHKRDDLSTESQYVQSISKVSALPPPPPPLPCPFEAWCNNRLSCSLANYVRACSFMCASIQHTRTCTICTHIPPASFMQACFTRAHILRRLFLTSSAPLQDTFLAWLSQAPPPNRHKYHVLFQTLHYSLQRLPSTNMHTHILPLARGLVSFLHPYLLLLLMTDTREPYPLLWWNGNIIQDPSRAGILCL